MSQAEEQIIQDDLDRLEEIGEDVSGMAIDMSFGMDDRIETISQAIRRLSHIKERMLIIAQN